MLRAHRSRTACRGPAPRAGSHWACTLQEMGGSGDHMARGGGCEGSAAWTQPDGSDGDGGVCFWMGSSQKHHTLRCTEDASKERRRSLPGLFPTLARVSAADPSSSR